MSNACALIMAQIDQSCRVHHSCRNHIGETIRLFMSAKDLNGFNIPAMQQFFRYVKSLYYGKSDIDWFDTSVAFKAAVVLVLANRCPQLLMTNLQEFVRVYPEFSFESLTELQLLMNYRNFMQVALHLISGRSHKGELLYLCGCLSGIAVTTGGGQKSSTTRRCLIYDRERAHVAHLQHHAGLYAIPSTTCTLLLEFKPSAHYALPTAI
jgi:hypothetical protein